MNDRITKPKILIYQADDCKVLAEYLEFRNFEVTVADNSDIMARLSIKYDLYILDHYKSKYIADLTLLKTLRKVNKDALIIMVSDLSKFQFIAQAYTAGADDYIIKPYNYEILVYKIKALLNRSTIEAEVIKGIYMVGSYTLDVAANILYNVNEEIVISPRESNVLALLIKYKNKILPTSVLMRELWNNENTYWTRRSLDVLICHLRNALKMDDSVAITTIRKVGYSLVTRVDETSVEQ